MKILKLLLFFYPIMAEEFGNKVVEISKKYSKKYTPHNSLKIKKVYPIQNQLKQFVDKGNNGKDLKKYGEKLLKQWKKIQTIKTVDDKKPVVPLIQKNIGQLLYIIQQLEENNGYDQRKSLAKDLLNTIDQHKIEESNLNKYILANNVLIKSLIVKYNYINVNIINHQENSTKLAQLTVLMEKLKGLTYWLNQNSIIEDVTKVYLKKKYYNKYDLLQKQKKVIEAIKTIIQSIDE
jgi:hypothetical protein